MNVAARAAVNGVGVDRRIFGQSALSHTMAESDSPPHTRSNAHETRWDVDDPTTGATPACDGPTGS